MASVKTRRPRPPLDGKTLEEIALRYVGRYATTRAKLAAYLARKIRERGWAEECAPDVAALAERLAGLGYVDDAAFALAKSQALSGRGYGKWRLTEKLRAAGVGEKDALSASQHADEHAIDAAVRFAKRRRIGPFATAAGERNDREKAIAAMVRAGHPFALARAIASLDPGSEIDVYELEQRMRVVVG